MGYLGFHREDESFSWTPETAEQTAMRRYRDAAVLRRPETTEARLRREREDRWRKAAAKKAAKAERSARRAAERKN
jgi:hypothetical protein